MSKESLRLAGARRRKSAVSCPNCHHVLMIAEDAITSETLRLWCTHCGYNHRLDQTKKERDAANARDQSTA